jgi:hypothetical protein
MDRPLYAYAYADVAYDDAIALLAEDPEGLLQSATDVSVEHADTVVSNLHVQVGGFDLGRDVVIRLGAFDPVEQLRGVLPVHWEAADGQLLFPTVDATLEVAALSLAPPMVQVTLAGAYTPPLGRLGGAFDRAVAHRVAEAVIHRFVHDLAERLQELVARASDTRLQDVPIAPRPAV